MTRKAGDYKVMKIYPNFNLEIKSVVAIISWRNSMLTIGGIAFAGFL